MACHAMIQIVCYAGGTCGDLICAMIDSTHAVIENTAIRHAPDRIRLKKPHLFDSDSAKHHYIKSMSSTYASIPSHALEYHLRHAHHFISITVKDFLTAHWAAERFQHLHTRTVWQEMTEACGANSTQEYAQMLIDYGDMVSTHTTKIIQLERILSGHAAHDLELVLKQKVDTDLYYQWLALQ